MIAAVLDAEVAQYVASLAGEVDEDGKRLVVRNGRARERKLLVFSPQTLIDNIGLGVAPTWTDFLLAIPLGMIAYTGIETISNMAEEAKDEAITIP